MDISIQSVESRRLNEEHAEAVLQDFGKPKEGKRTLIFRMDFPEDVRQEEGHIESSFMGCPMSLAELQVVMDIFGKCIMQATGASPFKKE